jgi:signal transduction histidine kinase
MNFNNKILAGLGSALAVLLLLACLTYRHLMENDHARTWVTHTHVVLEMIDSVTNDLISAETRQRGYIITGRDDYIEPYQSAVIRVHQDIGNLQALTLDNPNQVRNLDRLAPIVDSRLAELQEWLELRQQSGLDAAAPAIANGKGKQHSDEILTVLGDMRSEERRLLAARTEMLDASSRRTKALILAGNFLALVFLFSATLLAYREMKRRLYLDESVRRLNAELEDRIAERTAELQESMKDLARSNAELQQFAYVASHDLQEPLRMVASFTQLLAKRYKDKLDDDAREFIDFAVDGATRMQTLITDLLAYSRVGTQGKPLERTNADAVLNKVLITLKFAIEENKATISREPLPQIMADPIQLGQLFQNLLMNAMKFHGDQPPRIQISVERRDGEWQFAVRDNGIGIDPAQRDRIFVIFQRLHTKTEYPGTGIGLAICKKIAERHGGRIWVEPSPGGGSTFRFTAPVIEAKDETDPADIAKQEGKEIDDRRYSAIAH